jgi:hypothetical protein
MPQELEAVEDADELAEEPLDALVDDDEELVDDDEELVDDDEELVDDVVVGDDEALLEEPIVPVGKPAAAGDEADDDDEEEPEDEDVEASLDVILKERLVVVEPEEDEDAVEPDDRGDGVERVLPKQPDEFVCRSCFLVKHPNQLADPDRMFCRDCV